MIKPILAISFCALFTVSCGGSSSGGSTTTNNGGGTTGGGGDTGGGNGGAIGGQAGISGGFGDSADASNGQDATSTICPASITGSFTGWAQNGSSWCIYKCPAGSGFVNDDGDDWGFISANQNTCRDTSAAAGSQETATIFSPINGCPTGGCPASDPFPRVYISSTADLSSDSTYTCEAWLFDGGTDVWSQLNSPAPFTLTLAADGTGIDGTTATTWSFSNGVLSLETGRQMQNIAAGNGSFSSWNSNTSLTRCKI